MLVQPIFKDWLKRLLERLWQNTNLPEDTPTLKPLSIPLAVGPQ